MNSQPVGSASVSASREPGDRLDSWKEISAYLSRDISTVQRWEKRERMPVHRHLHDKLGSVYAFRSELDVWWRSRGPQLGSPQPDAHVSGQQPLAAAGAARRLSLRSKSMRAAVAGAFVLALAAASAELYRREVARGDRPDGAQELLVRARYLNLRTTNEDNKRAIELLEQAIALDPQFAAAYGELASAYVTRLAYVRPDETRELEQKAFAMASKALSIDPNAPEGYIGRGDLLWTASHRFAHESAVQQFRHALRLNPRSDETHRRLARVFVHVGFFDEAIEHADTALAINPSNAQALNSRAQALLWMGKDEEALAILSRVPGPVLPELVDANIVFALARLMRREEAWTHLQRAKRKYSTDLGGTLTGMEAMLLAERDPTAAQRLIDGLSQRKATNTSHHAAYFAAVASARIGRADQAVQWLREASDTGFPCTALFARDPNLDPIRGEPRFVQFIADMTKRSASLRKVLFSPSARSASVSAIAAG